MTHRLTQETRERLAKMYAELIVNDFLLAVTPEYELASEDEEARSTFGYGFANGALYQFRITIEELGIEFSHFYNLPYSVRVQYISADKYFMGTNATFSLDNQSYSVFDWDSTHEKWEKAMSMARKIAKDLGREDFPKIDRAMPQIEQYAQEMDTDNSTKE